MTIEKANSLGTIVALIILIVCNLIFVFRLPGFPKTEQTLGMIFIITSLPIVFLLVTARLFDRYKVMIRTAERCTCMDSVMALFAFAPLIYPMPFTQFRRKE